MGNAAPRSLRHLGRSNVKAPVDLQGIAVNDLAADRQCDMNG
jgi:hypothetical protein